MLIIKQQLEQADWWAADPDSDGDECAAMHYMIQLHEAAASSAHGLQMRTHLLPRLRLLALSLWMLVSLEHLGEGQDGVVVEDTEVVKTCADSTYVLSGAGTFRLSTSRRRLHWGPACTPDQAGWRSVQPRHLVSGAALETYCIWC